MKARIFDEALDLSVLISEGPTTPKFKMSPLNKFDGIGCPTTYLEMYLRALKP